jgi:hypothetical protein
MTTSTPPITTLELLAEHGHFPVKDNPYSVKGRYWIRCPFHEDTKSSLSLDATGNLWKCFAGCGQGGPARMRTMLDGGDLIPRLPKPPAAQKSKRPSGCNMLQLAEAKLKRVPLDFLKSEMGWYDVGWHGTPSVGIPYANGALRYRVGLTDDRFRWWKGSSPDLYLKDRVQPSDAVLLWVEGETNTAAGTYLRIRTVGIPGAANWKSEWAEYAKGRTNILWKDPDRGGDNLLDAMAQDIPGLKVIDASAIGVKDVAELLSSLESSEVAKAWLQALMAEAKPAVEDKNVAGMVKGNKRDLYHSSDIFRGRSLLWEDAKKHFPFPSGIKPWVVSTWLYSERDQKALAADFLCNSWENPANAQYKRQRIYFNLFPRLNTRQLYELVSPLDDWSPRFHRTVEKRLQREQKKLEESGNEGFGYVWFDNCLDRGHFRYLTNIPGVKGFTPVEEDVEALLVDTLKAIHPVKKEGGEKFHPYGVSGSWRPGVESTSEKDKGHWRKIAVKKERTDFIQAEAECLAEGIRAEMTGPYWRGQYGPGLEMKLALKEAVEIASSLGYSITRYARMVLAEEEVLADAA